MIVPYKSFTLNYKKYEAKLALDDCIGCAFEHDFESCFNHPSYCSAMMRPDTRDIIWVEVKRNG